MSLEGPPPHGEERVSNTRLTHPYHLEESKFWPAGDRQQAAVPFLENGPRIRWGNDQVGVLGLKLSVSSVDIWLVVLWTPPPLEQEGNTSIPLQQLLPCSSVSKAPVAGSLHIRRFVTAGLLLRSPPGAGEE